MEGQFELMTLAPEIVVQVILQIDDFYDFEYLLSLIPDFRAVATIIDHRIYLVSCGRVLRPRTVDDYLRYERFIFYQFRPLPIMNFYSFREFKYIMKEIDYNVRYLTNMKVYNVETYLRDLERCFKRREAISNVFLFTLL